MSVGPEEFEKREDYLIILKIKIKRESRYHMYHMHTQNNGTSPLKVRP